MAFHVLHVIQKKVVGMRPFLQGPHLQDPTGIHIIYIYLHETAERESDMACVQLLTVCC